MPEGEALTLTGTCLRMNGVPGESAPYPLVVDDGLIRKTSWKRDRSEGGRGVRVGVVDRQGKVRSAHAAGPPIFRIECGCVQEWRTCLGSSGNGMNSKSPRTLSKRA